MNQDDINRAIVTEKISRQTTQSSSLDPKVRHEIAEARSEGTITSLDRDDPLHDIDEEFDGWVATDYLSRQYGYGKTRKEAINDLKDRRDN